MPRVCRSDTGTSANFGFAADQSKGRGRKTAELPIKVHVRMIRRFVSEEDGQEIIEHTLIIALVVIFIAIAATGNTGVISMWGSANTVLSNATVAGS